MLDFLRRRLTSLARNTPLRFAVFLTISLIAGLTAIALSGGMNSFHDAQYLAGYERHARIVVTQFHQLPLWDPYTCGGLYGLAAPQTRYASPFFLLSLLFDVDRGDALAFVLMTALGSEGMFRYARSWGALTLPAFFFAPVFGLCGWFGHAFQFGWVQFLSFALVPFILVGVRSALRGERGGALFGAVAVAITIGVGGTYTLPMAVVPCTAELVSALFPRRARGGWRRYGHAIVARARRSALGLAVLSALTLGIGAYRLWPMLESAAATLRVMGGEPRLEREAIRKLLFFVTTPGSWGLGHFYFAPTVAALALLAPLRGRLTLWAAALLSLTLAEGHISPNAPFALLRRLPVYETLRYPERYLTLFVLSGTVLSALGATRLLVLSRRSRFRFTVPVLLALAVAGVVMATINTQRLIAPMHIVPAPTVKEAPFRQSRGNRWMVGHFAAEGMGSLNCGEAYPVPMSIHLRGDLQTEEYLVDAEGKVAEGRVERLRWTPNAITVRVESAAPVRLAVNQNYHPGWHASVGDVRSWDGLLTVALPAGAHEVTLRFLPRSGIGGLLASLVGLLGGIAYVWRAPRTRWARALMATAGPLTIALVMLVWPEEPWRAPAPLTDAGEPVLLSALPKEARPMVVRFDIPLAILGATLPSEPLPETARELPISLFFERTGKLSASLGIFVHVSGPDGRHERADHTSVSGRVYLPRLPIGSVGRDEFVVPLPADAKGEWEVRVGVWNVHGDGARRRVVASDATVIENALVVGRVRVGH